MGNYASDNIRTRQLEAERLFCGCALAASDIARQECAWLSPDIFLDQKLGKFWKAVLDGEESHDIAIRMDIASELVGYVIDVFSVSTPAPYARIIQECVYMRTVLVSIGDVAKKISASDLEGIRKIISDLYSKDIGISAAELASSTAEVVSKEFNIIVDNPSMCVKTYLPALDGPTGGFFSGDLIILAGRPGMGKCLGKGTNILMYNGSIKPVENIVVGDLLMGADSTPRRVLSTTTGREMMYLIKQKRGIDYRVNESHVVSLKRSKNEGKWKNGDVINISVREIKDKGPEFFSRWKGYKTSVEFPESGIGCEIPVRIERKKARANSTRATNWMVTNIEIIQDKVDDYYGFELDGDGLFLLEDMTVTHNTAIAAQIARNVAASGKKVLFVSLEMAREQLWARMACPLAGCEWKDVRAGDIDSSTRIKIKEESNKLAATYGKNLIIDDESFTVSEIHRLAVACNPDFIVIDQLPEIRWHDPKDTEIRWYGLAAKYLRSHIARSLGVPVLLLHQLSRGVEGRDKKRPRLSDLRFSGELEQRADMVLMTYREDYYEGRAPNQTSVPFEIWVMKNRQGDCNVCALLDYDLKGQWFT